MCRLEGAKSLDMHPMPIVSHWTWIPGDIIINDYAAAGRSNWLEGLWLRHAGPHSEAYSLAARQRLFPLDGQGGDVILDACQKIAKELVEGTFPWR